MTTCLRCGQDIHLYPIAPDPESSRLCIRCAIAVAWAQAHADVERQEPQ